MFTFLPFSNLVCLLTVVLATLKPATNDLTIVKTNAGLVSGMVNSSGEVHIFKGIPFAAPPVGALRWKAPQPV
ncbi:MAG TPA: carboxylesterase family protein, partial [Chitinophagaceae bacterium]|nr:carboxylesterase family protein [Chitinophagaceae bacterium]